jgi:transglutaminase-like putative cysteine protease
LGGEVKKLADKITKGKTTNLKKARAIYDWTVENMYRDPNTKGCGLGDVCELLRKPGGKCTDISSVFIALCRASGVPAREVFSIRLGKKAEEDITTYQHCWAEFFVPGFGWVTADPADVRKAMLVEKLELSDQKAKEYRAYFWGGIDAYRVVLAKGRDLRLNPPQAGAPLNTFGYPYAEVDGKALDFYDPKSFIYRYTFKEK